MSKLKVLIGRPCGNGNHRAEITNWLIDCYAEVLNPNSLVHHLVGEMQHLPLQRFPTDVTRNLLVKHAFLSYSDILFQVDDDVTPPPGFFAHAIQFLKEQPVPSVIACPYVTAPPEERVLVFDWTAPESRTKNTSFQVKPIAPQDAARRTGTERVANFGTGLVAYHIDVFRKVKQPYFRYTYNADHTAVTETEDTYCHLRLYMANVPLYIAWDHWLIHHKTKRCEKPLPILKEHIDALYLEHAEGLLRNDEEFKNKLKAEILRELTGSNHEPVDGDLQPDYAAQQR